MISLLQIWKINVKFHEICKKVEKLILTLFHFALAEPLFWPHYGYSIVYLTVLLVAHNKWAKSTPARKFLVFHKTAHHISKFTHQKIKFQKSEPIPNIIFMQFVGRWLLNPIFFSKYGWKLQTHAKKMFNNAKMK